MSTNTSIHNSSVFAISNNYHCGNDINCVEINSESTEQVLTLLLVLISLIISGVCLYLLRLFKNSIDETIYERAIKLRRPTHLFISYLLILLSLLIETICLMCLYWIPVEPSARNTVEGINIWTFPDGSPIYFSPTIDYVLHFVFWALFQLFIHLKVYGVIMQCYECNDGYYSPRHASKCRNIWKRFGYSFVILWVLLIMVIQIYIIIPREKDVNSSKYEQMTLITIYTAEFIVAICISLRFNKDIQDKDTMYLWQQWKQMRLLLIIGIIGWWIMFLFWMSDIVEYLIFRLCMILLYGTWISLFCYVETKWLLNELNDTRKDRGLSNDDAIKMSIDSDDRVINDILMDSIDTADFHEMDNRKKIKLSLIIENRKKKQMTKGGEEIFVIQKQNIMNDRNHIMNNNENDENIKSDSEDLYIIDSKQHQTRKTPNAPPRRIKKEWKQQNMNNLKSDSDDDDDDDMYQNNMSNGIETNGALLTMGNNDIDEKKQSNLILDKNNCNEMDIINNDKLTATQSWSSDSDKNEKMSTSQKSTQKQTIEGETDGDV